MMLTLGRGLSPIKRTALDSSLKATVASCVFDLDATKAASYPGSGQSWFNLVPAPADGSAKSAYDIFLGASGTATTDDPTFTGSAGSSSAYFNLDGGDYFRLANTAANTTFIKALHKTTGGTPWWMAIALQPSNVVSQTLFATNTNTTSVGIRLSSSSGSTIQLGQRGDTANATSNGATLAATINYLIIVSYDPVSAKRRFWVNTTTKSEAALAFNATSTDCNGPLSIGGAASGATGMANGTRIYAMSMGNVFIDDTDAVKLVTAYNARHGRTYA